MHKFTTQFVEFCEKNLTIEQGVSYGYKSLPICLIDCVYSLRAKYYSVTIPVVQRYADAFLGGNMYSAADTISQFIHHMDEIGHQAFADNVVKNHQKLGGNIPKEEVCYKLAQYLRYLHIETLEDFQKFESPEFLEIVIKAVKGLGDAGTNYLFMLAGDADRCKPDVHIHHCIKDACGCNISNEDCQTLFTDAVAIMREKHPGLTVRMLDGIIWRKYQAKA